MGTIFARRFILQQATNWSIFPACIRRTMKCRLFIANLFLLYSATKYPSQMRFAKIARNSANTTPNLAGYFCHLRRASWQVEAIFKICPMSGASCIHTSSRPRTLSLALMRVCVLPRGTGFLSWLDDIQYCPMPERWLRWVFINAALASGSGAIFSWRCFALPEMIMSEREEGGGDVLVN